MISNKMVVNTMLRLMMSTLMKKISLYYQMSQCQGRLVLEKVLNCLMRYHKMNYMKWMAMMISSTTSLIIKRSLRYVSTTREVIANMLKSADTNILKIWVKSQVIHQVISTLLMMSAAFVWIRSSQVASSLVWWTTVITPSVLTVLETGELLMISVVANSTLELALSAERTVIWSSHQPRWWRVDLKKKTWLLSIKLYWKVFPVSTSTQEKVFVHSWTVVCMHI